MVLKRYLHKKMKKILFTAFVILNTGRLFAQFAPAAGQPGSTAIHKDSSIITGWATRCYVYRGWQDINDTSLGKVSYGTAENALGPADNNVVSLGDSGFAIVSFDTPLQDKPGYDFAVFENAFNDEFLELAFVEVSSDSIHWVRFPSVSLTDTNEQVGTFGTLQPENIHNLAGKYRVLYGTPFDLTDIADSPNVDINNIKYIKIIDVIGSIKTNKYSTDSQGHKINDPYPTAFETGGFDLDAVAIIDMTQNNAAEQYGQALIYPNPADNILQIKSVQEVHQIEIYNINGQKILSQAPFANTVLLNIKNLTKGTYIVKIHMSNGHVITKKIVKK